MASLLAADMKLFAKLSCQGSICILCKWIEQLVLTSLNKTKIQIWKPYSSWSLSLFFLSSHSPSVRLYRDTKAHGSISLLFLTLSSLCIISHTLSCWETPNVYVPSVFFSSDPAEPPLSDFWPPTCYFLSLRLKNGLWKDHPTNNEWNIYLFTFCFQH